MKILQLNIWGGRLGAAVIELLRREQPDLVCFQEAIRVPGSRAFLFTDLDAIAAGARYPNVAFAPEFSFSLMKREAQMGLAVLSTLPLCSVHQEFTRLTYTENFDRIDTDYNVRSLQHVTVEYEGAQLHLLNHHGHHIPSHKDGDEETERQCAEIAAYLDALAGPVILCGDFNLVPESASLAPLNARLTNHVRDAGFTTTRTRFTPKTEVCDYIFTNDEVRPRAIDVLPDLASDHRAITLTCA